MGSNRKNTKKNPSEDYIEQICTLYGDCYDDRKEDSRPGGSDWKPRKKAQHRSLAVFQKELKAQHGINLSTGKIRKILITGGVWSTERSREVASLYEQFHSISKVAEELKVSEALVTMYLPYEKAVYDLKEKSGNAIRVQRWREKQNRTS